MRNVTLITGASSGIGRELAYVFAEKGHDLVLVARSEGALQELSQELREAHGCESLVVPTDLSDPQEVASLAEELEIQRVHVEVLVNNAGLGVYGLFHEAPWEQLQTMMMVNMVAVTQLTWHFVPQMIDRGRGFILNMGSIATFRPAPLMAVYYATKAYVLSFSDALRHELKDTGVSVTCLCPPPTDTKFDERARMEHSRAFSGPKDVMDPHEVARIGYDAVMRRDLAWIHDELRRTIPQ